MANPLPATPDILKKGKNSLKARVFVAPGMGLMSKDSDPTSNAAV
jgi:hypothetical protein